MSRYTTTPQTIRMSRDDNEWLEKQTQERGCSRADVIRDLVADARNCYGIPPLLRQQLQTAATVEGLTMRDYISELLRAHAQKLGGRRSAPPASPESPLSSKPA